MGHKFDGTSKTLPGRLRRQLLNLLAYRDDSHVAAWTPHKIDGYVWEAFSYIWEGKAQTAAELAEQLESYRSYDGAAYAGALEMLVARGWVKAEDGRFTLTQKGQTVRQEAEDTTNEYFGVILAEISTAEFEELQGLFQQLTESLSVEEAVS